jgi:hypothetical protein
VPSLLRRGASVKPIVQLDAFVPRLTALFDAFPASETPLDRRFERVLEEVPGLARENNLALVNCAAALLDPGESYVEIGSYRGTSLIAAMLGNSGDFVGIDHFELGDGSREQLEANLRRFDLAGATILEGDAFELVPGGALDGRTVGVYYYDAKHTYEAQLEGLRMIEPWLAERALLLVDDSDWDDVERATRDYVAGQPRATELLEIGGKDRGRPWWWEGVTALAWHR